jgi:hypothetical protein
MNASLRTSGRFAIGVGISAPEIGSVRIKEGNMPLSVRIDGKNKNLIIELPLEKPRRSASGKSLLLASSHGCKSGEAMYRGCPVVVAVNAFTFPKASKSGTKRARRRSKFEREVELGLRHPFEKEQPKFEEEEDD